MTRALLQILLISCCCFVSTLAFQSSNRPRSHHTSLPNVPTKNRHSSSRLFQSSNVDPPPRRNPFRKAFQRVKALRTRIVTRFRALPTRAKRIVVAQWLVLFLACGAVGKNAYSKRAAPPPIEVPYSRFLDLVEQQKQQSVPVMDQVRISTDRIVYRLYPAAQDGEIEAQPASPPEPTKPQKQRGRSKGVLQETNPRSRQQQPFVTAYTRKVPASPELVSALRNQDIGFTAAAPARTTSALALAVRSVLISFYFVILYRLYKTVSSAGGDNKKDVPGKLATDAEITANFDEIAGMDGVKAEVMELVDTIRNPEKYAILGARAPTGLLLEGPPGTGTSPYRALTKGLPCQE